jgi:hypothetical protein
MRCPRDQQEQRQAEAVRQRHYQNDMGFTGGEAAEKIAGAPKGCRRQSQAGKLKARVYGRYSDHRERFVAVG